MQCRPTCIYFTLCTIALADTIIQQLMKARPHAMSCILFSIPFLTDALVDLGTVLLVNLVDLADLLVPHTVLPGSSRLRSSVAAVEIVYTYSCFP